MKQKIYLLMICFLLLGSISFQESIACDQEPKKNTGKVPTVTAKKKTAETNSIPFDLFPFTQTFLLN